MYLEENGLELPSPLKPVFTFQISFINRIVSKSAKFFHYLQIIKKTTDYRRYIFLQFSSLKSAQNIFLNYESDILLVWIEIYTELFHDITILLDN